LRTGCSRLCPIVSVKRVAGTVGHAGEGHDGGFAFPPVHPLLVNFTAALVPVSLVTDVLGHITGRQSLYAAGWWTLVFGTVITPLTVLAGWLWLDQMGGMSHTAMAVHQWLGTALVGAFGSLLAWRWRYYRDRPPAAPFLLAAAVWSARWCIRLISVLA
jgi:uncharacterized membrane protein